MIERGVCFGKALQMTNVLRDCSKDLRIGRCYLPSALLERHGLRPDELLSPACSLRAQPVLFEMVRHALGQFRDGLDYTLAIPRLSLRLRLACVWPIVIGLQTLRLLVDNAKWLDPAQPSKVRRNDVYTVLVRSLPAALSDTLLRAWIGGLIGDIETRLAQAG
jgi:farnesyl-diphosphate farnesyltransferase